MGIWYFQIATIILQENVKLINIVITNRKLIIISMTNLVINGKYCFINELVINN